MKRFFCGVLILLFLANINAFSQTFCENAKTPSSAAGEAESHVYKRYQDKNDNEKELRISLTRPVDRLNAKKRPLIIGIHGSGFINSCFSEPCYIKYREEVLKPYFTPRGFITASIEYRLSSPLDFAVSRISDEKLRETSYKATQDVREAIKFIFENSENFGFDTENVFLVGTSAGAISALHAAFLDNYEVPKDLLEKYGQLEKREKIRGVVSLSGAIYDLSYLDGGDKIPLMIVHGTDDFIVPVDKGFFLRMKHLTPVYGGRAIFDEAGKKGIEVKAYFYDVGHSYPKNLQTDIFKNVNDFINSHLTCANAPKPQAPKRNIKKV